MGLSGITCHPTRALYVSSGPLTPPALLPSPPSSQAAVGRPTPENSAGPKPDGGHSSDDDAARARDDPSSAAVDGDAAPGGPPAEPERAPTPGAWMRNTATGRRSSRPRARNDTYTRRFASEESESDARAAPAPAPAIVAPQPRRAFAPVDLARLGAGAGVRTATPPPYLRVADTTAAELLVGSPGAGMAAADTLLMLLMTGGGGDDAAGGGDVAAKSTARREGSGLAPGKRRAAVHRDDAPRGKRAKTKKGTGANASGEGSKAKANPSVNPSANPTSASASALATASALGVSASVPAVVPDTAMYNAASAAAAKRRLLPSRGGGRQKVHRPWTLPEVEALVEGVSHYGRGQWADIKSLQAGGVSAALATRSAVDLKDKWRNLLRIAVLPVLYKRREATEVPQALLARVRELAAQKGSPRGRGGVGSGDGAAAGAPPKGARRSKHHSPWTLVESKALVDGVERCSGCRWTVIKKLGLASLERRTAMDLKDKWRNLLQLASLPSQSRRKAETPPELLLRVLQLEATFGVARRKGRKSGGESAERERAESGGDEAATTAAAATA